VSPTIDGLGLYCESAGWIPCRVVCYMGNPFVYPTDSEVGAAIARGWKWDNVLGVVLKSLIPGEEPVICEVGSNIGASLLAILDAKPRARVRSFEPAARFRSFLEYNLKLAGHTHVEVRPSLVSREAGNGFIHTDATSGSIRSLPHHTAKQPASITTLDHEIRQLDTVSFIKTDTDGHDMEVLRGAESVIRHHKPILFFEFCPLLMCSDPLRDLEWLQSLTYERLVCLNHLGFLVGRTTNAREAVQWSEQHQYCDILVCAEGSIAQQRLDGLAFPSE
jgi:FkbM family methyltransferase